MRHQPHHLDQWQQDGFVIIEDFFTPDEIAPLFETLKPSMTTLRLRNLQRLP